MQRFVIDSCVLNSGQLAAYLEASKKNFVIITDYLAMEAWKGDIRKSFNLLAAFSAQVVVLRNTYEVSSMRLVEPNLLIDQHQTKDFERFCQLIKLPGIEKTKAFNQSRKKATGWIDDMLKSVETLREGLSLFERWFSSEELKVIRKKEELPLAICEKMFLFVIELSKDFQEQFKIQDIESAEIRNSFLFRFSLAAFSLAINRIEGGMIKKVSRNVLRNDVIDTNFIAYATYFDGYLSHDKHAVERFYLTQFLLNEVFTQKFFL